MRHSSLVATELHLMYCAVFRRESICRLHDSLQTEPRNEKRPQPYRRSLFLLQRTLVSRTLYACAILCGRLGS